MTRYFTKSINIITPNPEDSRFDLDTDTQEKSMTVHEDDLETWTGLLDARGMEIHRSETIPMGFHKRGKS